VESLDREAGDYIQLASFRTETSLLGVLERLESFVPMSIWMGDGVYRLVAGPMPRDQVGLLVVHYRSQGFRDAFVLRQQR